MRRLIRLTVLAGLAVWAWRSLVARRRPSERVSVSFADGSSVVLEPGSSDFERLADIARRAIRP